MTPPESPERWQQIKDLYADALDLAPEQRARFLAQACAGDAELHAEVLSLLSAQEDAGDFIAQPVLHLAAQHLAQAENSTLAQPSSTPTTPELALGTTLEQRYLIEKVLERGGIGVVYLARDQKLHQTPVVIKVLQEAFATSPQSQWLTKKFQEEIKALARIDHPNVVRVLDRGTLPDGRAFLVMQYIAGQSLRAAIAPEGMDLEQVGKLLRQMGQGLSAAHEKGIIHRDLKPENIMLQAVGEEEYVKLIDFGLATVHELTSQALSKTTQVAGTPSYMAPEQFQGKPVSASDVYALGVIAYEMVTGRKPFRAESSYEMVEMQRAGVRVLPCDLRPNLPTAAQAVILKALSFAPADRYTSAKSFSEAFAHALTLEPPSKQNAVPLRKKRAFLVAALVALLALGAVGVLLWLKYYPPSGTPQTSVVSVPERQLTYWLTVQRNPKLYPNSSLFTVSDATPIFGVGDRVRLHVSSQQSGFLYLLNEDPTLVKGLPQYIVLFPEAVTNQGSAEVAANQTIQLPPPGAAPERAWFVLDNAQGEEKFWLVWAAQAVPELEAVKGLANPQQQGVIREPPRIRAVQQFLERHATSQPKAEKTKSNTQFKAKGETLVQVIVLQHR